MKTSTKILLAVAFVGTLGLTGWSRVLGAKQSQSPVGIVYQHHVATQIVEASDGDGETNDDVQEQHDAAKLQPLAKITAKQAQQAAEASVSLKPEKSASLITRNGFSANDVERNYPP
ncbi:MAG: hypothetical protein SAL70_05540 [Scytonema sp. PMC 1070.18]|nr:hypothetical protein [Scytonema sp. PMC 1070.18]